MSSPSSSSSSDQLFEDQVRHARFISEVLLDRKMTSSTSTATPVRSFTRQVEDVKTPKSDINALILDYLTVAGYPNAAANFSTEANLQPQQSSNAIQARQQIQTYIHKGEVEEATQALNDLDPTILELDPQLRFALLRLQLVELIRACKTSNDDDIIPALTFARTRLGPEAPNSPELLEDLEKTMSLLIFDHSSLEPSIAALLKPELRREVASRVNQAILDRQHQRREAAIRQLVQMRAWSEETARKDTKKDLPARMELGLDVEDGLEPMITT
ncbi:CTLH/CRA C-terminal to lish motif domain-containing protein [Xylariomycetidae sp. FL2044]|nr:CTLH/CRA C-terminal to lish motif domain-containing protein [Xylariomycetidae sp. FL2044]